MRRAVIRQRSAGYAQPGNDARGNSFAGDANPPYGRQLIFRTAAPESGLTSSPVIAKPCFS